MITLSSRGSATGGSPILDPPQQVNVRLPGSMVRAGRRLAERKGLSLPQLITHLLELEVVRGQTLLEQALREERELVEQDAASIAAVQAKIERLSEKGTASVG